MGANRPNLPKQGVFPVFFGFVGILLGHYNEAAWFRETVSNHCQRVTLAWWSKEGHSWKQR
jgi:hypothetical protein